jgi:hypothetical protein
MELAQYKLNYYFIIKYVNMSRLLYSHIFKFTVLEQANLLYCATATAQSRIRHKKQI